MVYEDLRRGRSGHRPFSVIKGEVYRPYEISDKSFLDNIYLASGLHSKSMWDEPDDVLIRGYNFITRESEEKKYLFVIGVVTDNKYRPFELCVTHAHSELQESVLDKVLTDMQHHLSLVLRPWDKKPESGNYPPIESEDYLIERYYPILCSPKNLLSFNITDVNRKRRRFLTAVSFLYYDGIAPPYVYDNNRIANMLHPDYGSSIIKRYEPDEEFIEFDEPKIIKFGETKEYDTKTLKHKMRHGRRTRLF